MQKYKYSFCDYIGKSGPLPEDANAHLKACLQALKSDALNETIEKAEKNKHFGHISVYDAKDALVCTLEVHYGVVKTLQLVDDPEKNLIYKPLRVVYLRTHRNETWSFRKKGGHDEV